ncbi:hypothetical protein LTR70_002439 [Exophiala xenobiotica]|uniref:Uncharacterized protein n=1 Tax=Lithohypha guttulata TaxID=1690604 RepID=A0ABR0KKX9_9EURO|nr:hypothetical protein LTR24_001436 [Lithohypha guttulata]KAK5325467.1 hypothetical protein LTR70_002439 [Exophiala xenobiotica]
MASNDFPPATRYEFDDFLEDVVRARLIQLFMERSHIPRTPPQNQHQQETPEHQESPTQQEASSQQETPLQQNIRAGPQIGAKEKTEVQDKAVKTHDQAENHNETETKPAPQPHEDDSVPSKTTPAPKCSCRHCQSQKDPQVKFSPSAEDFAWLDSSLRHSVAIALDAQQNCKMHVTHRRPQEMLDWYAQLFSAMIGVSVLGGGFTFTIIFSDLAHPRKRDDTYVRRCLAVSWLLFVSSIAVTSFTALFVSMQRKRIVAQIKKVEKKGEKWGSNGLLLVMTWMTLFVQLVPIGAFLASAEALRQYHEMVGAVSVGLTAFVGAAIVFAWFWQNVIQPHRPVVLALLLWSKMLETIESLKFSMIASPSPTSKAAAVSKMPLTVVG